MGLHDRYGLTRIINAAGTFTPLGVSRSSEAVSRAAAEALQEFFIIDELQTAANTAIVRLTGAEAGAVVHCASAGIALSIAAVMTGAAPDRVAALPNTAGLRRRVVLPAGHAVDYGHPIVIDVRLVGAEPILAGSEYACTIADLERELAHPDTTCLLLVSSRLVCGERIDLAAAVAAAHRRGVPAVIDGAAQDLRIQELLATGADLVIVSAQKYLASPTAGLVIGRRDLVGAVRAHEKGVGRAMKASKEAIIGVLAAIDQRTAMDLEGWPRMQADKVSDFVRRAGVLPGIRATAVADPAGMPFPRAHLQVESTRADKNAAALAEALKSGTPAIWVMGHGLARGELILELVPLEAEECNAILARLAALLAA
jgi:L-seryl-tRNA(Ser) seleniumtransferase